LHIHIFEFITWSMTNVIDSIIDYTLRSKFNTMNKFGNMLYINRQMAFNREKFITEKLSCGSNDKMQNILMEMKLLLAGRYAGNKDYLFERMNYLIECAFKCQNSKQKTTPKLTVNKKTVNDLQKIKKQSRCNRTGRFIARKKKK
jgi:hypothetical protein